ncbi:D-alanyl-D-alanine carboxypeptidase family protein [Streptomyces sp. NPDC058740]|uniref:D-alanyl-D-alanine carboxypeptidase family protein n=1 Tax=Streptomyces sp. NPDC058740 TaxID=3346619 RepID=UPI003675FB26
MAGESPDKAEQRESAAGGDGKDPRLSVLQDRVDEPTAVFKALAPRTAPEDEPVGDEPVGDEPAGDEPAAAEAGTEAGAAEAEGSGDGDRLRAAVAAWVAKGDEDEGAEGSEGDEGDAGDEGDEGAAGGETPSEVSEASEVPEGEPGADAEAEEAPKAAEEAPEARETAEEAPKDPAPAPAESWFAARKPAEPKAEPEAEAKAEAETEAKPEPAPAVDQPTAVFKAPAPVTDQPTAVFKAIKQPVEPRAEAKTEPKAEAEAEPEAEPKAPAKAPAQSPAKPPVDQPTTALKLPESMFRPLKGDITQEQPKPSASASAPAAGKATPAVTPTATPATAPATAQTPPASLSEPERTRQQPLPPRPPLEILAELTNTPPPPETPLRTGVRRVKIWTPLVLLLLVVFAVVQLVRPLPDPALTLTAAPTYTFEGGELRMPWPSEGQGAAEVEGVGSLGTYGPQKPAPIASVAKTMTAYVILRDHPIKGSETGPKIEVDAIAGEQAKAKDESTAPIKEGQTYTEKELLELLMIPSGNNVARLLARWDAGSEAAFVEKMNAAAKDLGMTGSTYTDPSGLQSSTMSTPLDQLKLAKAAMQYDVFRAIVDMPNVTIDGIPGRIENNNKILLEPGVTGIKTGSSTPAGGNLLWAANTVVDGKKHRILGIVMGAKDADQLYKKLDLAIKNSLTLIQQAQKDVTSAAVVKKGQVLGYVDDGLGGRTPIVATKELRAIGWPGLKVSLELTNGGKALPHSGKAGDVVGQVSIGTGNGKVSAPVALQDDLVEPGFDKKLTRIG